MHVAGGTTICATNSEGHYRLRRLRCLQSNVHCAASRKSEDTLHSLTVSRRMYLHSPVQVRAQNLLDESEYRMRKQKTKDACGKLIGEWNAAKIQLLYLNEMYCPRTAGLTTVHDHLRWI